VYYSLNVEIPEESSELLQAVVDDTGHVGMQVRDHTLKPPPGAPPLAEGRVGFEIWYEDEPQAAAALEAVRAELPAAQASVAPVEQHDWAEEWKQHVRSTRVGRIWVGPSWDEEKAGDAAVRIVIDPGMAFGTGDHPTTAMCLGAIDELMPSRQGCTVLDVGTGSGVLAIAAKRLGAGRVVGNDVDPVAVGIARENAARNGAAELELTEKPVERIGGGFDLVIANIFANVLCQLAPRLAARTAPDGTLLLTGILDTQAAEVEEAFEREGMKVRERRTSGEWVLLVVGHA